MPIIARWSSHMRSHPPRPSVDRRYLRWISSKHISIQFFWDIEKRKRKQLNTEKLNLKVSSLLRVLFGVSLFPLASYATYALNCRCVCRSTTFSLITFCHIFSNSPVDFMPTLWIWSSTNIMGLVCSSRLCVQARKKMWNEIKYRAPYVCAVCYDNCALLSTISFQSWVRIPSRRIWFHFVSCWKVLANWQNRGYRAWVRWSENKKCLIRKKTKS